MKHGEFEVRLVEFVRFSKFCMSMPSFAKEDSMFLRASVYLKHLNR